MRCGSCGGTFTPKRGHARYCSSACRSGAFRAGRDAAAQKDALQRSVDLRAELAAQLQAQRKLAGLPQLVESHGLDLDAAADAHRRAAAFAQALQAMQGAQARRVLGFGARVDGSVAALRSATHLGVAVVAQGAHLVVAIRLGQKEG